LIGELAKAADERAIDVARKIEDLDRALARGTARRCSDQRARSAQASVIRRDRSPSASEGAVRSMSSPSAMRSRRAMVALHTLQIASAGSRAEWWLEALVAQASAEDWDGVRLGLSTADLIADGRLPELPSLRLGRAQAPARPAASVSRRSAWS